MKKLTKAMKAYFTFWGIYLPLMLALTILFDASLKAFLVSIGFGALLLFILLTIGLVVATLQAKREETIKLSNEPETSATPASDETLEGFRELFTEVKV